MQFYSKLAFAPLCGYLSIYFFFIFFILTLFAAPWFGLMGAGAPGLVSCGAVAAILSGTPLTTVRLT